MIARFRIAQCLPVWCLCCVCWGGLRHPDLDDRIELVTSQIQDHPQDSTLYLSRGELHLQHEQWDSALADFERVLQLNPKAEHAKVARAMALFKGGWPISARRVLNDYLLAHPDDSAAILLRGRTQAAIGEHLLAAADYSNAIKLHANPKPDLYIELAEQYALAGDSHLKTALESVELGIKDFGPLITLELFAVELEIKLGSIDRALHRLDGVMSRSARKERFYIQRGEILLDADRFDEAKSAFESAIQAIASLPPRIQANPASRELRLQAVDGLARAGQ